MKVRAVAVGLAPAPAWVEERVPGLPSRPAPRTVYLLAEALPKPFPALVWAPSRAACEPARYYDPSTLSVCQIQLAYSQYRCYCLLRRELAYRAFQYAPLIYLLLDEKGYIRDFNAMVARGAERHLGVKVRRGMHYRAIVRPESLADFEADFAAVLRGQTVYATRHILNWVIEVIMTPIIWGKRRFVAYHGLNITVHYQLMESFARQREVSELVANTLSEGILTLRQGGELIYANASAEAILGPEVVSKALLSHLIGHPQGYFVLGKRLLHWESHPIPPDDLYLMLLRDVTQSYRTEQENLVLREGWEIGPTGIAVFGESPDDPKLLYSNPRIQSWFSDTSLPLWKKIQQHLNKNMRKRLQKTLTRGEGGEFQLKSSYRKHGWSHLRLYLYPLDLRPIEVAFGANSLPVWTGRVWIAIFQDETTLYQMARRRLFLEARQTRRILQAQEQERQRLAEELHDQVGALLSVIRMSLATLLGEAVPPQQEKLQTLLTRVDEVIRSVRLTSHLLMPPLVEHFGLRTSVEALLRRFDQASPKMRFLLSTEGEEPLLTTPQKLHIYRILQELLTNALRHSEATQVEVFVRFRPGTIHIEVRDNGRGYDPRHLPGYGIGLRNIEARLKLLKATSLNRSEPGRGACFVIEVPVSRRLSRQHGSP